MGDMEMRVYDNVITSRSSLDLLVLNELLAQGCAVVLGSLWTTLILPDSESWTGGAQL
jgi:hypothetical protein